MWVSQSYLGNPDEDAKVYAYYLFEDYSPEQKAFTKGLEARLAHVGDQFGRHATILMPNEHNAPRIEAEVREALGSLWEKLANQLPGLLVTTTKLSEFSVEAGNSHFFSLAGCDQDTAFDVIASVHRVMRQCLEQVKQEENPPPSDTLLRRVLAALELKPGIYGIRFDLKAFFRGGAGEKPLR